MLQKLDNLPSLTCSFILQYLFFVLEYFLGYKNENCPIDSIITTQEECKEASLQLEIKYENELKDVDYPVGCNSKPDSSSYLNTQLGPTTSTPENFENHSGICKKGIRIYFFEHLLLLLTKKICQI